MYFDCDCSMFEVKNLTSGCEGVVPSISAAVALATFELVRDRLIGSTQMVSKSKTDAVHFTCTGKKFVLVWTAMGSFSALRKSIALACVACDPHKTFQRVKSIYRTLSAKMPSREEFDQAASSLAHHVAAACFFVVGRVSLGENAKEKAGMLADTAKKFITTSGKSSSHKHTSEVSEECCVTLNTHEQAVLLHEFATKTFGKTAYVTEKNIVFSDSVESQKKKLSEKKRQEVFIGKYSKLDKYDFGCFLAYYCNVNALTDGETILNFIDKPLEALKSALKQVH
jgi:hypothetical protein